MEYEVVKPGYVLLPHYALYNTEGVMVFVAVDQDPAWRRRPRPMGRYVSTGWIPGNLLAEGRMIVAAFMRTLKPDTLHYRAPDAVAFQVIDDLDDDTARGDYARSIPGVVRPLLKWCTKFIPNGHEDATMATEEESQP
jgi:lipopolysaccharide transport system ATP-binding protein